MPSYVDLAEKIKAPREGVYSNSEQYWTVRPVDDWEMLEIQGWVSIGGPGVDGIQFCCHGEIDGIHTYYPVESRFEFVAENVADLVKKWQSGSIKV